MTDTRLKLVEVERRERDVRLRLPFRFGVTTVTHATQAVIRATVALPDGRTSSGVAAETLASKWFDKNLALSDEQNLDQLRQSLELAIELYKGRGFVPRRNIRSSATIRQTGPNTMVVEGCALAGLLCKEQRWTRVRG